MICPDNNLDCDNVGCRRGGCQGRRPNPPLFRVRPTIAASGLPLLPAEIAVEATALQASQHADQGARRQLVVA